MLPFVFEDGFGYERYLDYALDVPMYFVYRDGKYIDVAGESFRAFLEGKFPRSFPARSRGCPTSSIICSTIFPEVRLKSFLEMRGADGGRWGRICGLPALLGRPALRRPGARRGLGPGQALDDRGARAAPPRGAEDGAQDARHAGGGTCATSPRRVLEIASDGLDRGAPAQSSCGDNEGGFLDPLREVSPTGMTPADRLLDKYQQ